MRGGSGNENKHSHEAAEEVALERLAAMLALSRAEERRVAGRLVWLARDWTAPGEGEGEG